MARILSQQGLESGPDRRTVKMKRARFMEEQTAGLLERAEVSAKVADLARRHGVTDDLELDV